MSNHELAYTRFRSRLKAREALFGSFIKIPTTHATEIIAGVGFDFVILDQEHAPIDRAAIDVITLAARAAGIACFVRVGDATDANILSVLDGGATGILVPHVNSVAKAREIAAACRYQGGKRGFANTTRGGGFGAKGFRQHRDEQDSQVTCIAMIEDIEAVDDIDAIAAVEGIDAFFIGRGDLTAALGLELQTSPETRALVERITAAARKADMPIIVMSQSPADAEDMKKLGASTFILSSDQGFIRAAAGQSLREHKSPAR